VREHAQHRVDRFRRCLEPPALLVDLEECAESRIARETNRRAIGNDWRLSGDARRRGHDDAAATMRRGKTRVRIRSVVRFTSIHSPVKGEAQSGRET
jgi:hypothetical protein